MPTWTLITNHAAVLLHIARNTRTTARDICSAVGITERAARKIIADLYANGYISKKKEGRRILYTINHETNLRQDVVQDIIVGDFLEALGWEKVEAEMVTPTAMQKKGKEPLHFYQPPAQKQKLMEEYDEQASRLLVY
ncbi:MAG: winged helix-turn-helix domain-containing protein [Chloroflexota bacterium]